MFHKVTRHLPCSLLNTNYHTLLLHSAGQFFLHFSQHFVRSSSCHSVTASAALVKLVRVRQMVGYVAATPSPQETRQGLRRAPVSAAARDWFLRYGRPFQHRTWAHSGQGTIVHHPPKVFVGVKQPVCCQEEKGWLVCARDLGEGEQKSRAKVSRSVGHPDIRC